MVIMGAVEVVVEVPVPVPVRVPVPVPMPELLCPMGPAAATQLVSQKQLLGLGKSLYHQG